MQTDTLLKFSASTIPKAVAVILLMDTRSRAQLSTG
ncbi:hypothetical protein EVA_10036 [gut metagenome]|uniref:Uncharacterized protein n=1 Tax=gut metagenome TaxID=749906 RepID=J9G4R7_9ZZZZ